ncbi:hypothetical protein R1flu_009956 [Riccia fluitans]|uniref:Uncharacterized protein n=1 Tax=Riccia fluitans TaxID=41844 RepID=A0ABD1Z4Q4_9MARC
MATATLSPLIRTATSALSSCSWSKLVPAFSVDFSFLGRENSKRWLGSSPRASIHGEAGTETAAVSLVQGASRGLGLEFAKQLLGRGAESHVIATCRNPDSAEKLIALKEQFPHRLSILPLDVTVESSIEAAAKAVKSSHGRLDLLVNTAGILHVANVVQPETSLSRLNPEAMLLTYQVNAVGPMLVTKHMWPLLKRAKDNNRAPAVVANLSARVGSIGDNEIGGWYSYRASKSALNQLTKTASVESVRQKASIVCILLHPGTVDTDLSKPFQKNVPKEKLFTTEYSVRRLLGIIDKADLSYNAKFFAWDGQEIPW